jgi:hypothetical protein
MYTVRLYLADKNYVGTERSIKLAQRTAAQLALDDCRSLPLTNNYDQDISQINGKRLNTELLGILKSDCII